METEEKVLISQDNLEEMRWDASRSERSKVGVVVGTGIIVGAAVVAGVVVYYDVKSRAEHSKRMEKFDSENLALCNELEELKRQLGDL